MSYTLDERGQGLVEYALILVLVSIAVVVILGVFGEELLNTFTMIRDEIAALT